MTRLAELSPRWLINEPGRQLFIFLCPHCRKRWLSCKNFVMDVGEQIELFAQALKVDADEVCSGTHTTCVPMRADVCWTMSKADSFETISVTPSINASPSGDWHGFITEGQIR